MKQISWGILSSSRFAVRVTIPATQKSIHSEVLAIASRDSERAKNVAADLNIPKSYGSYEDLLNDPHIDAIYNPLPNHLHVEWTIKALEAGKHVLCEKPIALNHDEAESLKLAASKYPKLKVMEAFMYRHHPQWAKVKEIVSVGKIGAVRRVHSVFNYFNDNSTDIRNRPELGGGAMLDIGCYCTSVSRFVFGAEPVRVFGEVEVDPATGTDRFCSGLMDFGQGMATFSCATQLHRYQHVDIHGTNGRIEIDLPFNPPNDRPSRLLVQRGDMAERMEFDICDQYTIQADLFAEAILDDQEVPTPLDDAVANMKVIDGVFESARLGGWVTF